MVTIDRPNRHVGAGARAAVSRSDPRFAQGAQMTSKALLVLFLITILLPARMQVAGLLLSPTRIFLLLSIIPLTLQLFAGRFGRIVAPDWLLFLVALWMMIALIAVHGVSRLQFAGITAVEAIGGYMVGRAFVRHEIDFRYVFKFMVMAMVVLLPFTIIENVTGSLVLPDLLRKLPGVEAPIRGRTAYGRLGLERVYSVFAHPILWGLFCSMAFSNVMAQSKHTSLYRNLAALMLPLGLISYSTFSALSSAPLLSLGLQIMLLAWGFVMGGRWKLLCILVVSLYVMVDLASNRTPVSILFDTLTFNSGTAWTRVAIFDYGKIAVMQNPVFGVGFNPYNIPEWLTTSVDNFWLLLALRYGLPGLALWVSVFLCILWGAAAIKLREPRLSRMRQGYLIALTGIIMTLITVHVWDQMAVFIMFYLGAGVWFYNDGDPKPGRDRRGWDRSRSGRPDLSIFPFSSQNRAALPNGIHPMTYTETPSADPSASEAKVSVVIPCFNREDTIEEAVASVLEQSFGDLEVIAVDDGSQDRTWDLLQTIDDPRLRLAKNPKKGVSSARNYGVSLSKGARWIAFQDSDDVWLPQKLEQQMAQLEGSAYVASFCGMLVKADARPETRVQARYPDPSISPLSGDILPSLVRSSYLSTQMLVIRRDVFDQVGGFDEELQALVDWELMLRVAQAGPVGFVDQDLVVQRMSENSITRSSAKRLRAQSHILNKHQELIARYPGILAHHHHRLAGGYRMIGEYATARAHASQASKEVPGNWKYRANSLYLGTRALFG